MPEKYEQCLKHELKYYLDLMQYQVLRKKLGMVLKPDSHARSDGLYHVRSLYFDDFRNTALYEKQNGIPKRKKYRIRIYNHSDEIIKLERKTKLYQYVFKESAKLTREEVDRIILGDITSLANSKNHLLKAFYLESRNNLLRPVIIVDYHREAYVHSVGNVRITLDKNLRISHKAVSLFDPDSPTIKVIDKPSVILEIKFDNVLPPHIQGLFPNTIQLRSAIGKFFICRTKQICQEVEFYTLTRRFCGNSALLDVNTHYDGARDTKNIACAR